jgi:Fe-S-cluster containining protein
MATDVLATVQKRVLNEELLEIKCEPQICGAACCHNEVGLNLYDIGRLIDAGYKDSITNMPDPRGIPNSYIPMLKKENGKCIFLSDELKCKIYGIRPDICRLYPHTKNPSCRFPANLSPEKKAEIIADKEEYSLHLRRTIHMLIFDREWLEGLGLLKYFTTKI